MSTTARLNSNIGYHITGISDTKITFDRFAANGTIYNAVIVNQISLSNPKYEFAQVHSTQEFLK